MSEPQSTQERYPRRTLIRTGFQLAVAVASIVPYVVAEIDLPLEGFIGQVVGVCLAITRVMAMPRVNEFLRRFFPLLAPDPAEKQ